ncbi:MAG TPA: hypothetical protein VJ715_16540 [Pyrinomonadaceae bacterium]|nr:hypothetical protein [Pyrinomonadaceae bacterium]
MRTRKTIRPAPFAATRWAAWASQLAARRERVTGAPPLSLPLYVRLCRAPLVLYQRWLTFCAQVQPRIKISVAGREAASHAAANVYAPQLMFLQSFVGLFRQRLRSEAERRAQGAAGLPPQSFEFRSPTPVALTRESAGRPAMTLAVAQARVERLSSTLHQHFFTRQEAMVTEVSKRLTKRVRRVDELSVFRLAMSLRKETPAGLPKQLPSEAAYEQSSFERQQGRHVLHAATPAPELNVERLADQVLKQIDRRVIARRERMGQI